MAALNPVTVVLNAGEYENGPRKHLSAESLSDGIG
jgi:hypothetical protein